jgi:hypothetical protein
MSSLTRKCVGDSLSLLRYARCNGPQAVATVERQTELLLLSVDRHLRDQRQGSKWANEYLLV